MNNTTSACRRRSHTILPHGRPGTGYRKYEPDYTDALITTMAVACLLRAKQGADGLPKEVAVRLLPEPLLSRLQADPMVWEDWLGFFKQSRLGGLYEVSVGTGSTTVDLEQPSVEIEVSAGFMGEALKQAEGEVVGDNGSEPPERSQASGWQVVDAIKVCLDDGTLPHNEPGSLVHVDRDGRTFLQSPAVFEEVKTLMGLEEGAQNLENRFKRLKINRETSGGWKLFKGKSLKSEPMVKGYVVEDGTMFWGDKVPQGRFVIQDVTTCYWSQELAV